MNKVCISGRLIKDPEFKELENNNAVCNFFIANNVHFGNNKKTGFYKCVAWGNLGKIIKEHAKTGTELYITGRLDQNKYEDKDGKTVYDISVVVEQFDFGAKSDNLTADNTDNSETREYQKQTEDIPF